MSVKSARERNYKPYYKCSTEHDISPKNRFGVELESLCGVAEIINEAISKMQTLKAIYENGVFRPLEKPELAEGQSVQLIVDTTNPLTPQEMLQLAAEVYEGLSETDVDEIEEIALKRDYFLTFSDIVSNLS